MSQVGESSLSYLRRDYGVLFSLLILGFMLVHAAATMAVSSPAANSSVTILGAIPPLCAASLAFLAASRSSGRRLTAFWFLVGVNQLVAFVGQAIWLWTLDAGVPMGTAPMVVDTLRLLSYTFMLVAILIYLLEKRRWFLIVSLGLDVLLSALAASVVVWQILPAPESSVSAGLAARLAPAAYPFVDTLVFVAVLVLLLHPRQLRLSQGVGWVGLGLLVAFSSDVLKVLGGVHIPSVPSAWPNYVWILSSALVAVGGLAYVEGPNTALTRIGDSLQPLSIHISEDKLLKVTLVLPFFVIPLVSAILAYQLAHTSGSADQSLMYALTLYVSLFLIAAVLFRQLAAIVENSRLHSSLNSLSKSLEERVELRTKELAAERDKLAILNLAATKISHSTSSTAVINGVLDLIMEATHSDGAAIHSPTGTLRFLGSRTANRVARAQLARATKLAYGADETSEVGLAAAQNGVIIRVWDESEEYRLTACLPLISRGERVASLCLGRRELDFLDSHDCLELAQSLAGQVAVALDNARRYEDAHYLAERDPVTGLLNHRGMNKRIQQEIARCARTGSQCAVVMMDVDNFKIFNDTWGHPVGDSVLMAISQLLTMGARKCDIAARYGGDEFLMLLADADSGKAVNLVRRVQESINNFAFTAPDGCQIPILLSYGIASYPSDGYDLSKLLIAADDNLYLSKSKGGDCITSGETELPPAASSSGTFSALDGLVTTVDNKDHYTRRHSDNVCTWAVALAKELGLSGKDLDSILIAGLLHDVGKIAIPDRLLKKPGKLTDDEFETVKQHVSFGELVINDLPNIGEILQAVSTHHERWDGKGYPRGMKGEEIPLAGRIMAVADAYSAMTTNRPYRKALTPERARKELRSVAGSQLDPKVVKMFLKLDEIDIRSVDDEFPTLLAG